MLSLPLIFASSSNLIFHAALAISLKLIISFAGVPALLLYGLHTYIHPDDVNPNPNSNSRGIRAAIRRPGAFDSELSKPRKKSKGFEFDESKAQIFRLKLNDGHLESRIFFKEFSSVFSFTFVGLASLLLHKFLWVDNDSGILKNGSLIPLLLGSLGVCRGVFLLIRVGFERSASKRLEKELSLLFGFLGFLCGLTVLYGVAPKWVLDYRFESLDELGKFFLAVSMGCIMGLLYIPALRNARAFWLGTDQVRCNLSIISCGWIARMLLFANYMFVVFTSLLWISPFSEFLVNEIDGKKGSYSFGQRKEAIDLVGHVGMSKSDFDKFRLWCLLITGLVQISALRPSVQMFLNEAVLCWYQRLHGSKVPDLEYSRAKVFLHNHYVCLVVLQLFVPGVVVILLLGLSQINGVAGLKWFGSVKEVALFLAWWVVFAWAVFTSGILALYRRGVLYVS